MAIRFNLSSVSVLFLSIFVFSATDALAQNWSFDSRRIAMGGVGSTENIASRTAGQDRSIVLPFGLFQVLPDTNVFDPSGDDFNPVCAMEYAASPIHYTLGRSCNLSDPGPRFVSDIVNAQLSRDLNDYGGFRPDRSILAEGLASPNWGKTFTVGRGAGGTLHQVYAGAGPYLSIQSQSTFDPALIELLGSATPVYQPHALFTIGSQAASQMAMAITGGYRTHVPAFDTGNDADGVYVAANYNYLHGFHLDRFDLATRFNTDAEGLLTAQPATPAVTVDRVSSSSGSGFALDFGTMVVVRRWAFGFGANGVANRIDWEEIEREQFVLDSLVTGGDFEEVDLVPTVASERVELPVTYTGSLRYRADRWSVESDFSEGLLGRNFHGGLEYKLGRIDLRGGGRYARNRWHPSGGAGFHLTPQFAVDVAAFGTSANIERRRDVALAVSLRFTPDEF